MQGRGEEKVVRLRHGSGGLSTKQLISAYFLPKFKNEILAELGDSAKLEISGTTITFTTDSYVVSPLFFPGGDIGKLAIAGTVNDLTVAGSKPLFISAGFILEEGMPLDDLARVLDSMAKTSKEAGVKVVAGDTKVVERGRGDGTYINTSGVGVRIPGCSVGRERITPGDSILVTAPVGNHGLTIFLSRMKDEIGLDSNVKSDCRSLNHMLVPVFEKFQRGIHWCRDVTRGGLFTILNEALREGLEINLRETDIPVDPDVKAICEALGLDPCYLANEGVAVLIVEEKIASSVLDMLRKNEAGRRAAVIGEVQKGNKRVYVETEVGGSRVVDPLVEDLVPRIC